MKAKLVWNFSGEGALKTAEHHLIHLKEYAEREEVRGDGIWNPATNQVYCNRFYDCSERLGKRLTKKFKASSRLFGGII